jgi:DNA-binding CsgD family transcriptional regulator
MRSTTDPELLDLIDRIYEAQTEVKNWSSVLEGLETASGQSLALFMPFPIDGAQGHVVAPSVDPELLAAYQGHYFRLDPVAAAAESLPAGAVAMVGGAGSALPPSPSFEREWLAPQGFVSAPACVAVVDRDASDGTTLLRGFPRGAPRLRGRSRTRRWQELMPHLRRACRVFREMQRLERRRLLLEKAIDRLAVGIVAVDADGRVVLKNAAADRILAQRDGLYLESDGIHASSPATTQLLRHPATAGRHEGDSYSETARVITVPRGSGRRPLLLMAAEECVEGVACARPDCTRTLYVTDPEREPSVSGEGLRHLFNLTPAETALAREILEGHCVESAALRLGVGTETARSRLKVIFRKTRTHRQSDLMRLLLVAQPQLLPEDAATSIRSERGPAAAHS